MKKYLLFLLANFAAIGMLIAQDKSITQEQALSIVQSYYNGLNVEYYALPERTTQWEFFVDEKPNANWEHDCAIYTFPNTFNLAIDTIPQKQTLRMPPDEGLIIVDGLVVDSYKFSK